MELSDLKTTKPPYKGNGKWPTSSSAVTQLVGHPLYYSSARFNCEVFYKTHMDQKCIKLDLNQDLNFVPQHMNNEQALINLRGSFLPWIPPMLLPLPPRPLRPHPRWPWFKAQRPRPSSWGGWVLLLSTRPLLSLLDLIAFQQAQEAQIHPPEGSRPAKWPLLCCFAPWHSVIILWGPAAGSVTSPKLNQHRKNCEGRI